MSKNRHGHLVHTTMTSLPTKKIFCGHEDEKECQADRWDRPAVILGAVFVVLLGLDVATTVIALNHGYVEGNPILAPIVHNLPLFLLVKAGEVVLFIGIARAANRFMPGGAVWVYLAANATAMVPVVHNIGVLAG